MLYRTILATSLALSANAVVIRAPPKPQVTKAATLGLAKRQQPDSAGSSVLDAPMTIAAGDTFDGGNVMYDRGESCSGGEGGSADAVFILEAGASLSNVIIGPNQKEGVHCFGGCTINNVWWDAVCEDAFSIKEQSDGETTTVSGGGAKGAEDKVIQHNGGGTVVISDFTVSDFGKLYRSCGNCDEMPARHVQVTGGSATDGSVLVGINPNMGDTASISGVSISGVDKECVEYKGVTDGSEPEEVGLCDGNGGGSTTPTSGGSTPSPTPESAYSPSTLPDTSEGGQDEDEDEDDEEDDDEDEDEEDEDEDDEDEEDEDEEEYEQGSTEPQPWESWFN